ncbi:hypothetical protein IFM89_039356 [Coptis chinensis]|uniref:Uncharacterized protein n=1 Tax=Coptis chinensis TaxID=261450 RepID=A0A835HTK6_9MAGN|nr:hypothetical protein IFM89_039356 [Coptis chinensis]
MTIPFSNYTKLAKVREHNESVLREAAITSTSYSETLGAATERASFPKEKKPTESASFLKEKKRTLASMLRKKETPNEEGSEQLQRHDNANVLWDIQVEAVLIRHHSTKQNKGYDNPFLQLHHLWIRVLDIADMHMLSNESHM